MRNIEDIKVIKKDRTLEPFDINKVIAAVSKSAQRALKTLTKTEVDQIKKFVIDSVSALDTDEVPIVPQMHIIVEQSLDRVAPEVAKQYRDYRNYKQDFVAILDDTYAKDRSIRYLGDKENSNTDSALVSTKRSLVYGKINKEFYKKFELTTEQVQACVDGYIYVHDMSSRRDTMNCCLFDMAEVLTGGFEMGNLWYNEPTTLDSAFDIIGDITLSTASQQYGGFTIPNVDRLLAKYAKKSYNIYLDEYKKNMAPLQMEVINKKKASKKFTFKKLARILGITETSPDYKTFQEYRNYCVSNLAKTLYIPLGEEYLSEPTTIIDRFFASTRPYPMSTINEWLEYKMDKASRQYALNKVRRDFEQGFQGWEYKFNSVGSSRGDYPFITITLGNTMGVFEEMATESCLKVRRIGQGAEGKKKPVLFPKIVFLFDHDLHMPGKPLYHLTKAGVKCSAKTMYPDWLSLTGGNGYLQNMYNVYGLEISPMGAVAGNERVEVRINNETMILPFEDFWGILVSDFNEEVKSQFGDMCNIHSYMEPKSVEIYDSVAGRFVKVYNIIRNTNYTWIKIELANGKKISTTLDHPFTLADGRDVRAENLQLGDVMVTIDRYDNITNSEVVNLTAYLTNDEDDISKSYAYDVETETQHFDVSGIWSHNCRAFLSPYYERGGFAPADENDKPVFVGRWNGGAISLHLPMILAKAREEGKDFYEVLDYYMEMIRDIHKRTREYLGKLRASVNPVAFCEGGFYRGHLDIHDRIEPLLDYVTFSYGITALNELQRLYNGKSLVEDNKFCLEVMKYINNKLDEYKKEDHILYAVYGTPAESLCGLQIQQFRKKYGIIKNVSDREYISNSFHCHVTEDISPIEKQDIEEPFWELFRGGRIQYCRYPISYNLKAIESLILRAMDKGYYEGVNLSLSYCNECGHEELEMDVCPKCGSKDLTKIDRMNGYLSYSRVKGDTRLNAAKMAEIADRKSM